MNKILNIFIGSILVLFLLRLTSCDVTNMIDIYHSEASNKSGAPMILKINIEDGSSETRSSNYLWKDGAILLIEDSRIVEDGKEYVYAVYKENIGWIAYNLNGKEVAARDCPVFYSECWTIENMLSYKNILSGLDDFSSLSSGGDYSNYWFDYTNWEWKHKDAACSYKDGFLYLDVTLSPVFGRVRFVSDNPIIAEYNHAKHESTFAQSSNYYQEVSNSAFTDYLTFSLESDGRYYSNYIYSYAIPELRVGDYVYKYRGNNIMTRGESGVIEMPQSNDTDRNWICEKYFEIIYDTEQTLTSSEDSYFLLFSQEYTHYWPGGNSPAGQNIIHSAIGLNIDIDFTLNTNHGISITINSDHPNYSYNCFSGISQYNIKNEEIVGSRKSIKIHNCNTYTSDWFFPYIWLGSTESPCNLTIHNIKISNF